MAANGVRFPETPVRLKTVPGDEAPGYDRMILRDGRNKSNDRA